MSDDTSTNVEPVVDIWTDEDSSRGKAAVPRMADITRRVSTVSVEIISSNVQKFLHAFEPLIEAAAAAKGKFEVEEIELALAVNGKGGVELLGKMEAGASASIKVKLKRKKEPTAGA